MPITVSAEVTNGAIPVTAIHWMAIASYWILYAESAVPRTS